MPYQTYGLHVFSPILCVTIIILLLSILLIISFAVKITFLVWYRATCLFLLLLLVLLVFYPKYYYQDQHQGVFNPIFSSRSFNYITYGLYFCHVAFYEMLLLCFCYEDSVIFIQRYINVSCLLTCVCWAFFAS